MGFTITTPLKPHYILGLIAILSGNPSQALTIQSTPAPVQAEPLVAQMPVWRIMATPTDPIREIATVTTGWAIDASNRQVVRAFFNSVYLSSVGTPIGWTGTHTTCTAGDTSAVFKQAVLSRINFYRAMVGVPATVVLDALNNAKAQKAALMMSTNNTLSHTPPSTWSCYSTDGAQAAGNSNISLGHNGWNAVDGQMRDNGTNNTAVGHRRWLTLPQAQTMGTGDVAAVGTFREANAIWVPLSAGSNPRPVTRDTFVAWPTRGFNPYTIVPKRWSFAYPKADFSKAVVTMSTGGQNVPVTIDSRVTGYGENTLVWRPYHYTADSNWVKPTTDTTYQVTVSQVLIGGVAKTFSYPVTIFDPEMSLNEPLPTINGSTSPTAGIANTYGFNAISLTNRYDAYIAETATSTDNFTAETTSPIVTGGNSSTYALRYSGTGTNGTTVYRLSPASSSETFTLPGTYLPSATSTLVFDSKLGYATTKQTAAVQVSTNNGVSWVDVYAKVGTGTLAENVFSTKNISLSSYANKLIQVRVQYRHSGSYYVGTDSYVSFLVDNLKLTNAKKVVNPTTKTNLTSTFTFTPILGKTYIMAARAVPWLGYPGLDWGALLYVNPVLGQPTNIAPTITTTTRTPTYSWKAVVGATQYTLYVSDVTQQGKIQLTYTPTQANCASTTLCSVTPTIAVSGAVSWKAQAKAGTVTGAWSTTTTFTAPPDKTTVISPAGLSLTKTPSYSWKAVPGATQYYLWVDNGGILGKIKTWYTSAQANCSTGTTCAITPTTTVSGAVSWKVQTKNTAGLGAWSSSVNFNAP